MQLYNRVNPENSLCQSWNLACKMFSIIVSRYPKWYIYAEMIEQTIQTLFH